ncbi:hypothetical protein HAX54_013673 [Datura stramonium]|uniref:Uncharacterized protein n=1 Tax=Datura stramonium TaxID=4076 RepID=A0ABS8TN70_DATST|nr:hypothetical protein [Datura stramonium]
MKKVEYYEDCPGCKVEQLKRSDTSVPVKPVFFISMLCRYHLSSLSSILWLSFHIAEGREDISYYAGYVGSSFIFGKSFDFYSLGNNC